MGAYNDELGKAGVLLALDGLTPPATMSARVTFKDGKSKVTDGPFPETKEVVGGFWIIQVKSREEALEWASRIPGQDNEMVEVRRLFDMTDFDPETQKEIQERFGDDVADETNAVKKLSALCRIPVRPFDYREGRATVGPKTVTGKGEIMPQYLVAIHHPDDWDASIESEAMLRGHPRAQPRDDCCRCQEVRRRPNPGRQSRSRCGRSPTVKCSSPTGRIWRPRSTSAVFGCWKPLTWTRRWRGGARLLSPAGRRSRCARFFLCRLQTLPRSRPDGARSDRH